MEESERQTPGQRERSPELVGSYTVIATIARAELTHVYLAQRRGALGFSRLAAIKRLNPTVADQAGGAQILLDAARLSAGVRHANIVDVVDVGTESGCHLVMDYVEGADLEDLLNRAGKERHARYVLPPIVDALHGLYAMHTALDELGELLSMVHQAPCARHILIGIDGTARLADFTQVSARGLLPSSLRTSRLRAAYMAPEQLLWPDVADARSDLFVVGITLWEALTGERLFQAEAPESIRRAVLERHVPKPSEVGLKPPRCFDAICLRALARNPDQRHESALALARELRDAALQEGVYATSGEVGTWVRALAGRTLIERRRALGADAPSLELAIDAFGTEVSQAAGSDESSGRQLHAAPPRARASAPRRRADPAPHAPLPSEPSHVTTVPGLGTPALELPGRTPQITPAPAGFPAPPATLLDLGERMRRAAPARGFTPARPGARRDPAQPSPGSYSRVAADRHLLTGLHSQPTVPVPRILWDGSNQQPLELESGPSGAFPTGVGRGALPEEGADERAGDEAPHALAAEGDADSLQPPGWPARTRPPPEGPAPAAGLRILTAVLVAIIVVAALVTLRQSVDPRQREVRSATARPSEPASAPDRHPAEPASVVREAESAPPLLRTPAAAAPTRASSPAPTEPVRGSNAAARRRPSTAPARAPTMAPVGSADAHSALPSGVSGRTAGSAATSSSAGNPASPASAAGSRRVSSSGFAAERAPAGLAPGVAAPARSATPSKRARPAGEVAAQPGAPQSPSSPSSWRPRTPELPDNPY